MSRARSRKPSLVEYVETTGVANDCRVGEKGARCTEPWIDADFSGVAGAATRVTKVVMAAKAPDEPRERVTSWATRRERLRREEGVVAFPREQPRIAERDRREERCPAEHVALEAAIRGAVQVERTIMNERPFVDLQVLAVRQEPDEETDAAPASGVPEGMLKLVGRSVPSAYFSCAHKE